MNYCDITNAVSVASFIFHIWSITLLSSFKSCLVQSPEFLNIAITTCHTTLTPFSPLLPLTVWVAHPGTLHSLLRNKYMNTPTFGAWSERTVPYFFLVIPTTMYGGSQISFSGWLFITNRFTFWPFSSAVQLAFYKINHGKVGVKTIEAGCFLKITFDTGIIDP